MAPSKEVVLNPTLANEAHRELMSRLQQKAPAFLESTYSRPFYSLQHTTQTRESTEQYCMSKGREHAAKVLNTVPEKVQLEQSHVILYTNIKEPCVQQPAEPTPGKAFTIIAFGELTAAQGLPTFGSPTQHIDLSSGEVLLASGDLLQHFEGKGGGLGFLAIWSSG